MSIRHVIREDILKEAADTGILEFKHIKSEFTFIDPIHMKDVKRFGMTDSKGIPDAKTMARYREVQNNRREIIDPNYSFRTFMRFNRNSYGGYSSMHSFRFSNDWRSEFINSFEGCRGYDNPLDFLERYAVRKDVRTPGFPNFFDPISYRVRIMRIIGSRYFLSDNGYVCNADEYNYETEELKMRRKYILL